MFEARCVLPVLGARDQPKLDAFHGRLAVRRLSSSQSQAFSVAWSTERGQNTRMTGLGEGQNRHSYGNN
jgi:hypothetical protein